MKLVNKKDLRFIDGHVVTSDDTMVGMPDVAAQYNELKEMQDILGFVDANRAAIEASGQEPVVYAPPTIKPAAFTPIEEPATPLHDAEVEKKQALALEFLTKQETQKVNQMLKRYGALAGFLASDYIKVHEDATPSTFMGNVLELTETDVVETVTAFCDPEFTKLRGKLVIQFA